MAFIGRCVCIIFPNLLWLRCWLRRCQFSALAMRMPNRCISTWARDGLTSQVRSGLWMTAIGWIIWWVWTRLLDGGSIISVRWRIITTMIPSFWMLIYRHLKYMNRKKWWKGLHFLFQKRRWRMPSIGSLWSIVSQNGWRHKSILSRCGLFKKHFPSFQIQSNDCRFWITWKCSSIFQSWEINNTIVIT